MTRVLKMVMKGFKSFGNKVELEFGSTYNCVLGPNGAGKSNIMDALCFVLGKGSAKGLRAEKAANLIYNGGKKKEPAKQGEVSIYFDNSTKTFPLEDDVIKITRIIRSNGQSVYKINDQKRTRQQILDLLAIANIDPDGYNIILQGDIVRLIEMSGVERRQIIEDIAGISIYEEKKNKALNELAKVEEKLNEAEIILSERQTYLKDLRKERDQALKYKDLNDRIKRTKATYTHIQIHNRQQKKEEYDKQIEHHEKLVEKLNAEISGLRAEIAAKKKEEEDLTKEIEEKGEKDQIRIMKDIEQLKVDIATNKTRIGSNENELVRIESRKDQLQKSLSEIGEKIDELLSMRKAGEKELDQNTTHIEQINRKIVEFRKKHKLEDSEQTETDMDNLDKQAEEKESEIQKLKEEQQNLLREKDKTELYIQTVDEKIGKVLSIEKEHKLELDKLKNRKDEFKKTTVELNQLLNEDSSLAAQLANARDRMNELQEKQAKLNAQNSSLKQTAADSIAVKSILDSKDKFGQVYGTVSELGQVSSKYALALEIAAGPRIKSIVVDSDKTAAACIKHLKAGRLGTATFLPLNKIKAQENIDVPSAILKANGVVGKALDLISFEPKLKPAFHYVFGNTIVVNDIDVSRRVGIGSVRMVTLDGDLVEVSGAMHGGFRQKKTGSGFAQREIASELSEVDKKISEAGRLVSMLEKKRKDNEERIGRLRELKATLEGEIIKTEKSLHLESGDLSMNRKEKDLLQDRLKEVEKKLFETQAKVSVVIKALTDIKIRKQQLKVKITEMRNPRLLAELNTFEEKKTELKESIIKLEAETKNYNMQIKNILEPEKENTSKILSQHDRDLASFGQEIKDLRAKIKEQEKDLKDKEKVQTEFYGKYKGLFVRKDKLGKDIQKDETSVLRLEEQVRNAEHKANSLSVLNAGIKAELSTLLDEMKHYEGISLMKGQTEEELKKETWQLEKQMEAAGNINMRALEVYDKIEQEYNQLQEKKEKLLSEKDEVMGMMNEIETRKKDLFLKTFDIINAAFQDMFSKLAPKGEAFLELENPKDPLSDGMRIKVRITGKKFLDIRSLSGGEKTMTALAFIFAIQEHEPASFYIFDEVDAALDKRNSQKLSELVKKYSDKAQYILISHNDGVISEADTLYGVSMDENSMSKVVSLKV